MCWHYVDVGCFGFRALMSSLEFHRIRYGAPIDTCVLWHGMAMIVQGRHSNGFLGRTAGILQAM